MQRRGILALTLAAPLLPAFPARGAEPAWPTIRQMLFQERELRDGSALLRFDAPARAADAAVVPMTIEALQPQRPESWIRRLWLVIDENPAPVAGVFHFRPEQGVVSLATRVRVNAYTPVHVIAETSKDDLYVVERFVKAAGGCSAPGLKDAQQVMARLGQMRFKPVNPFLPGEPMKVQVLISHPNYTGMQMDQFTRNWIPPNYVQRIKVRFAGRPVLEVEGDISLSEDPNLTFSFIPEGPGELEVQVTDSEQRSFAQSWPLGSSS